FLDHLPDEPEIAGIEHFQLGLHPQVAQNRGTLTKVVRRRDVSAVTVAEVETAAVERGDIGTVEPLVAQVDYMAHAVFLTAEVGSFGRRVLQSVVTDADIAAHAAGEVDDDVDLAFADALYHFTVVTCLHAEGARFGVAHMNVHDRGACLGRLDGGIGNLLGRNGAVGAPGDLGVVAGDGTGDDDI